MIQYLSIEEILVLHSEVVDATGGVHGVRDAHLLASIADKPKASFGGVELYEGVFTKSAIYLEATANYHAFIDGNKRTSIIVSARFLHKNGYELSTSDRDIEEFILGVAKDKTEIEIIAKWLKDNSKQIRKSGRMKI